MRLSNAVIVLTASTAMAAPVQLVARQSGFEALAGLVQPFIPFDISSYVPSGGSGSRPASPTPVPAFSPSAGPSGPPGPGYGPPSPNFGTPTPNFGPPGPGFGADPGPGPEPAYEPESDAPAAPAAGTTFLSSIPFVGGIFQSFGLKFSDLSADGKLTDAQLATIKAQMTPEKMEKIAATLRSLYTVAE